VRKTQAQRLADLIPALLAEHQARRQAATTGELRGPVTRLERLDNEVGGALPQGAIVLQGGPGVGKTALGLQFASDCGFSSLFVTAEMSPLALFERLIARQTKTFLFKLRDGAMDAEQLIKLAVATADNLPGFCLLDATTEPADSELICEAGRQVDGADRGLFVVIDSLQVWSRGGAAGGPVTDYELVTLGMHTARGIAVTLNCPVLLVSHRHRAGQQAGGLYASKGSGDIEYQAEVVLELTREPDAQPDAAGEMPASLTILKNRHGQAGMTIPLRFCGRLQNFRDATGQGLSFNPAACTGGRKR